MKQENRLTVLVERGLSEHLTAVLEESLTELLGEDVVFSELDGSVVDGVLHVVDLREGKTTGQRRRKSDE